jgi:excisionase family DNA binding protein
VIGDAYHRSPERFLTTSEAAAALHISAVTLYRWINAGKLPASKPGKHLLVAESDVRNLLEAKG